MTAALLAVEDVSIGFDGIRVLDHLSLSLAAGELRFLIGPNGAGKTTLIDVITGKTRPQTGHVRFAGHDTVQMQPHQIARLGLGRKFQTPAIFASLSVRDNLEIAGGVQEGGWRLLRPVSLAVRQRLREVLETTGLQAQAGTRAGLLSHGQQQWLEIGMLLMQRPTLLLLDEPVAGLTRAERNRTSDVLHAVQEHCAMLIVEHDMAFVRQFDAVVTVLHQGRVLVEGPLQAVQQDERVIEVYLGRLDEDEKEAGVA